MKHDAVRQDNPESKKDEEVVPIHAVESSPPDPEVSDKAHRRRFTGAYKLKILAEVEACHEPGQIGAILRREGLYSSHLMTWRKQREEGILKGLMPKVRGRKTRETTALAGRVAELEKANAYLQAKLKQAETIIDVQKKLCTIFGTPHTSQETGGNGL